MAHLHVFIEKTLRIEMLESEEEVSLHWAGKSNEREPGRFLSPILDNALCASLEGQKLLVLDFRALEYMNSSTFTPVVKLLERARKGPSRVRMVYRAGLKWQHLSFSALRIFETHDRRIELCGE